MTEREMADGIIKLFLRYRDEHGYTEPEARKLAVNEALEAFQVWKEMAEARGEQVRSGLELVEPG
jgi:hypothetical protein